MELETYELQETLFDEMFRSDRSVRSHYQLLHDVLTRSSSETIREIQTRVNRAFSNEGISFTVYGSEEANEMIIPVDCLPRIVSASEWRHLEAGLVQRLSALNRFLADVYGECRLIDDGVIPADMIHDCPQYREIMRGISPPHGTWVAMCGTDIVRTHDGFRVLEDNLRVPSGVSYMIANRKVVKANFRRLYRQYRVRGVEHFGKLLRTTLHELAGMEDPCVALLTPGIFNSAYYEHMFLSREIGAELVQGADLVVDNDIVYMRTTAGLRRVDVIYRRVDDDFIDPEAFRPDSLLGVPGLMRAYRKGNVVLANAPGTGVADDKSVYAYVPDMIRYYLGEEPILSNVETRLCRRPEDLEFTLDNLESLVVKRVGESGGYGMLIGPHATAEERTAYAEQIRSNPADFISQPVLGLSTGPCMIDDEIEPRHLDLRPFVLMGQEARVTPGAFSRVALRRGSLVVNSSQGGGGKDCWVLSD